MCWMLRLLKQNEVASFGKNFTETENIIALFGVKLGIANKKLSLR
jgi:hypothetical protein